MCFQNIFGSGSLFLFVLKFFLSCSKIVLTLITINNKMVATFLYIEVKFWKMKRSLVLFIELTFELSLSLPADFS